MVQCFVLHLTDAELLSKRTSCPFPLSYLTVACRLYQAFVAGYSKYLETFDFPDTSDTSGTIQRGVLQTVTHLKHLNILFLPLLSENETNQN